MFSFPSLEAFLPFTPPSPTEQTSLGEHRVAHRLHLEAERITSGCHAAPPSGKFFSIDPFGRQHSVPLPRPKKHASESKTNSQCSDASQQASPEERNELQVVWQLTMVTASTAYVFREIGRAPAVRFHRLWALGLPL